MDYITKLSSELGIERKLGILPILQDLYGDKLYEVLADARTNSVSASEFVDQASGQFGLQRGDEQKMKYQAALVNFAREADWVARNGAIYSELDEGGVLRLTVGGIVDGKMQFDASVASDASLADDGLVPSDEDFLLVTSAGDIDDAVDAFHNEYQPETGVRLV